MSRRALPLAAALLAVGAAAFAMSSAQQVRILQANVDRAFLLHFLHLNRDKVRPASGAVRSIGARIVRATGRAFSNTAHVYEMASDEVNAQTSPGGDIFLYKGLLDTALSRDETAAVLAHEVAHIAHRHWLARLERSLDARRLAVYTARTYGQTSGEIEALRLQLQGLSYDRAEEYQADETGTALMVQAGFDPEAMLSALDKVQTHMTARQVAAGANPYLANHPAIPDRITRLRRLIDAGRFRPRKKRLF